MMIRLELWRRRPSVGEVQKVASEVHDLANDPEHSVFDGAGGWATVSLVGPGSLTFNRLREANISRCEGPAFGHTVMSWEPTDWACALAGEVGEACNLIKKLRRGEDVPRDDIARELADVQAYLDLLAARLGINLGEWTARKFNEVSERRGAVERLP